MNQLPIGAGFLPSTACQTARGWTKKAALWIESKSLGCEKQNYPYFEWSYPDALFWNNLWYIIWKYMYVYVYTHIFMIYIYIYIWNICSDSLSDIYSDILFGILVLIACCHPGSCAMGCGNSKPPEAALPALRFWRSMKPWRYEPWNDRVFCGCL